MVPFNQSGDAPPFNSGVFTARLLFDLSFFVIVTTIGLNIVFGIIVDSFSELREERVRHLLTSVYVCVDALSSIE